MGYCQTTKTSGMRCFVNFIEKHTHSTEVYLIGHRSDISEKSIHFIFEAERHTGQKICVLKIDHGGEDRSTRFCAYAPYGIEHEKGPANTPQKDSVPEKYNRPIMKQTRGQTIHTAIPQYSWGEMFIETSFLLNMSPTN